MSNEKDLVNSGRSNNAIFPWDFNFFEDGLFRGMNALKIMNTDIKETQNGYTLKVEMPGVKKENVDVEVNSGYLTITATECNTSDEDDDEEGEYVKRERYCGTYSRKFYVGDVDRSEVSAKLNNGMLIIKVPKNKQQQNNKIEIK